jgi:cyclophilin family peptidyl-prolyl cis-trans isomerase
VKLRTDVAPKTCQRIQQLIADGLYKDCVFYRAEPDFVVQGGLTKSDGKKLKSPYGGIPLEYNLENTRGKFEKCTRFFRFKLYQSSKKELLPWLDGKIQIVLIQNFSL